MRLDLLGERLRTVRKLRGFTLALLSEVTGIPKGTLANWECGQQLPPADRLRDVCRVLDCRVDLILGV